MYIIQECKTKDWYKIMIVTFSSYIYFSELQHAMSMRLVSSGSYNVRASEMAHYPHERQPKAIPCIVHFLDDSHETFEVDVSYCFISLYFSQKEILILSHSPATKARALPESSLFAFPGLNTQSTKL